MALTAMSNVWKIRRYVLMKAGWATGANQLAIESSIEQISYRRKTQFGKGRVRRRTTKDERRTRQATTDYRFTRPFGRQTFTTTARRPRRARREERLRIFGTALGQRCCLRRTRR